MRNSEISIRCGLNLDDTHLITVMDRRTIYKNLRQIGGLLARKVKEHFSVRHLIDFSPEYMLFVP